MCSDLLLLGDLNFFPYLDPDQPNLTLASDQCLDECPLAEVNAVSGGHLNTSLSDILLQDILQNQTVRVTDYCIVLISTYTHSSFAGLFCVFCTSMVYMLSMHGGLFCECSFLHICTQCTHLHIFSIVHFAVHISWESILWGKVFRVAVDLQMCLQNSTP